MVPQVFNLLLAKHTLFFTRAGRIDPAAPVLTGPVFSQGKSKIPFLQKLSSASVILGLVRHIILSYNR